MNSWKIDQAHSEIIFKVKHLMISTVTGHFDKFDAAIETSKEDFGDAKITFSADVNSINTKNEGRDGHLKSPDFFDAAKYPALTFVSTSVKKLSDFEMEVTGNLTMRGVTKNVKLAVLYNGTIAGMGGVKVAAFEITGKANRFDFGLQWNALTETGGVVVGNEVKFEILAEFNQVLEAAKAA
jgi:polyisoprenoid-binding protein YceI